MKKYQQLTLEQRYQIYALLKAGHSKTEIGRIVGKHKTTIGREIGRNRSERGYRPGFAHRRARERIVNKAKPRISERVWAEVDEKLASGWSPEQISGRLALEGGNKSRAAISHEWIYRHIYRDKQAGGTLYLNLRGRKQYRKRYGRYDKRGSLVNQTSIEQRPKIVDKKTRFGDWELDTVLGKRPQKKVIVTMTERKSKLLRMKMISRRKGDLVKDAVCQKLAGLVVKTLTSDNGREFSEHQAIAKALNASFYFCHPYASWERGLNENTNGLIRQYFPKNSLWDNISQSRILKVQETLNNRPRKSLGFRTPNELFFKHHQQLISVALTT